MIFLSIPQFVSARKKVVRGPMLPWKDLRGGPICPEGTRSLLKTGYSVREEPVLKLRKGPLEIE
jgi:hypothetical protein